MQHTPLAQLRHSTRSMRETAIRMREIKSDRTLTAAELHDLGDWLLRQVIEIDGAVGMAVVSGHLPNLCAVVIDGDCAEVRA